MPYIKRIKYFLLEEGILKYIKYIVDTNKILRKNCSNFSESNKLKMQ